MPLHDYYCRSCGNLEERFVPLKELYKTQFCKHCLAALKRLMPAPRIQMDYPDYTCPVTGKLISGRRAHKENLKKTGCRILETGEHEANLRRREEQNKQLEEKIEDSVAREISSWSAEKQSKLCQEMESGLSITYERK